MPPALQVRTPGLMRWCKRGSVVGESGTPVVLAQSPPPARPRVRVFGSLPRRASAPIRDTHSPPQETQADIRRHQHALLCACESGQRGNRPRRGERRSAETPDHNQMRSLGRADQPSHLYGPSPPPVPCRGQPFDAGRVSVTRYRSAVPGMFARCIIRKGDRHTTAAGPWPPQPLGLPHVPLSWGGGLEGGREGNRAPRPSPLPKGLVTGPN